MTMVRQTKQRTAVIEVLQASRTHPDAAQVHAQVREKLPSISLGTVYRTLDALVRDGMVTPIERVGQATRYDYRREGNDHHHAPATPAGAIFDVPVTSVPAHSARAPARRIPGHGHQAGIHGRVPRLHQHQIPNFRTAFFLNRGYHTVLISVRCCFIPC